MKMKFIALAIAGSLIVSLSHAQLNRGSLLFGGTIGYKSSKYENKYANYSTEGKIRYLTLSPSFAYAISNNLFLGADLTWETSNQDYTRNDGSMKSRSYTKGGGVFVRRYWKMVDKLYLFGQGRAGYTKEKLEPNLPSVPSSSYYITNTIEGSLHAGLSLALSRKVHLESTLLNLVTVTQKKTDEKNYTTKEKVREYSSFDAGSTLTNSNTFTLGVKILLSK